MSKSNMKNDIETNESAFRTPQALGRAVKRVSSHLPSSPRKKRAVISKIAKSSGLSFSAKGKPIHQKGNKGISDSTITKVQEFYCKDSVPRQAPGRKDYVIVRKSQRSRNGT